MTQIAPLHFISMAIEAVSACFWIVLMVSRLVLILLLFFYLNVIYIFLKCPAAAFKIRFTYRSMGK